MDLKRRRIYQTLVCPAAPSMVSPISSECSKIYDGLATRAKCVPSTWTVKTASGITFNSCAEIWKNLKCKFSKKFTTAAKLWATVSRPASERGPASPQSSPPKAPRSIRLQAVWSGCTQIEISSQFASKWNKRWRMLQKQDKRLKKLKQNKIKKGTDYVSVDRFPLTASVNFLVQ